MVPGKTTLAPFSFRGIAHGDGLFVHIQTDVKRVRVSHG
jgi:hypothetical protein